jgi:hypothetical protein
MEYFFSDDPFIFYFLYIFVQVYIIIKTTLIILKRNYALIMRITGGAHILLVLGLITNACYCFPRSRPFFAAQDLEWNQRKSMKLKIKWTGDDEVSQKTQPQLNSLVLETSVDELSCPYNIVEEYNIRYFLAGMVVMTGLQLLCCAFMILQSRIVYWYYERDYLAFQAAIRKLVTEKKMDIAADMLRKRIISILDPADANSSYSVKIGALKHQLALILLSSVDSSSHDEEIGLFVTEAYALLSDAIDIYNTFDEDVLTNKLHRDVTKWQEEHINYDYQKHIPVSLAFFLRERYVGGVGDDMDTLQVPGVSPPPSIARTTVCSSRQIELYKKSLLRGNPTATMCGDIASGVVCADDTMPSLSRAAAPSAVVSTPTRSKQSKAVDALQYGNGDEGDIIALLDSLCPFSTPGSALVAAHKQSSTPHSHLVASLASVETALVVIGTESPTGLIVTPERPADGRRGLRHEQGEVPSWPSVGGVM